MLNWHPLKRIRHINRSSPFYASFPMLMDALIVSRCNDGRYIDMKINIVNYIELRIRTNENISKVTPARFFCHL